MKYTEIRDHYFKTLHDEGSQYISGLPLPDPKKGPYHFINCELHPRIWAAIDQLYMSSKLTDTYNGGVRHEH